MKIFPTVYSLQLYNHFRIFSDASVFDRLVNPTFFFNFCLPLPQVANRKPTNQISLQYRYTNTKLWAILKRCSGPFLTGSVECQCPLVNGLVKIVFFRTQITRIAVCLYMSILCSKNNPELIHFPYMNYFVIFL